MVIMFILLLTETTTIPSTQTETTSEKSTLTTPALTTTSKWNLVSYKIIHCDLCKILLFFLERLFFCKIQSIQFLSPKMLLKMVFALANGIWLLIQAQSPHQLRPQYLIQQQLQLLLQHQQWLQKVNPWDCYSFR